MLKFFSMIIRTMSPERNAPPEHLIPTRLAKLFAKEDVWLVMSEPGRTKIPEGCNFILWFESDCSPEELLKAFESKGWQAQVGYSGFTLTQRGAWGHSTFLTLGSKGIRQFFTGDYPVRAR